MYQTNKQDTPEQWTTARIVRCIAEALEENGAMSLTAIKALVPLPHRSKVWFQVQLMKNQGYVQTVGKDHDLLLLSTDAETVCEAFSRARTAWARRNASVDSYL